MAICWSESGYQDGIDKCYKNERDSSTVKDYDQEEGSGCGRNDCTVLMFYFKTTGRPLTNVLC